MASIWMLEDVVIIGGLCLLCSAMALTLLTLLQDEGLKYMIRDTFRRFVSKSTNHRKKQKRLKKEQKDKRINEKTQAIADNVSWQEIFTVNTTPVLSELKQHVVNTALIRPCSKYMTPPIIHISPCPLNAHTYLLIHLTTYASIESDIYSSIYSTIYPLDVMSTMQRGIVSKT